MRHEFWSRWTGEVIHTEVIPDDSPLPVRLALEQAAMRGLPAEALREVRVRSERKQRHVGADERRMLHYRIEAIDREIAAPTTRAELTGAVLTRAVLTDAELTGAVLTDAVLTDAVLTGAVLTDAVLTDAVLTGAVLTRAELTRAELTGAELTRAELTGAELTDAVGLPPDIAAAQQPEDRLTRARRRAAYAARYRERHPEIPVVPMIDSKIMARVRADRRCFAMSKWHCGATHCRAGQGVDLAGEAGYALERRIGSHRAGLMIYRASAGYTPYFFGDDEPALADIESGALDEQALADHSASGAS